MDELSRLFDDVASDSFGVNFDPSYLAITGIDPMAFVKRFAARIRHVHLKDHIGKYPDWKHRIPGQGELDYVPKLGNRQAVVYRVSAATSQALVNCDGRHAGF